MADRGFPCPACGVTTQVVETRQGAHKANEPYLRRRRRCADPACGRRFTTMETAVRDTARFVPLTERVTYRLDRPGRIIQLPTPGAVDGEPVKLRVPRHRAAQEPQAPSPPRPAPAPVPARTAAYRPTHLEQHCEPCGGLTAGVLRCLVCGRARP